MTDTTTQKQSRKAQKTTTSSKVIDFPMPESIEYNLPELEEFIRVLFANAKLDENILTWAVSPGKSPAFPVDHRDTLRKLERNTRPKAFYFGTSTCAKEDGALRNRFALFQALHVVALDDVGTKVPKEKLDGVTPTYKVESSQDNFQYGFALRKPITNPAHAKAFIKAIYSSGYTDEGGAMPTKLVRLPCGVNGKKGTSKEGFRVQLAEWNPEKLWDYDELLDALNVPYTYETIISDANLFRKSRTLGTSAWANTSTAHESATGMVDPVLEWLYEENMVVSESNEWVTIQCPWHEHHTTGDELAGYNPLGRGSDPSSRGFHCFHGHCEKQKTMDFLEWVREHSDIEAAPRDMSAELVRNWVFDSAANGAWNVSNPDHVVFVKLQAFKELFARKVWIPTTNGKSKAVPQHHLWTHAPNRLTISGCKPFTGSTDLFVEEGGHLFMNLYQAPLWGEGEYDDADVDRFLDYLEYLIPDEQDRLYFLNWLVAKIQDPCFRGAAIVMVAELQGVGRSTLGDMIGTLLGHDNKAQVNFDKLLSANVFNEWATKPLVISDETLTTQPNMPRFNSAYEALKDFVDPRPKKVEINPKYGLKYDHHMVTSFLLFSNHRAALAVPAEDRRLYVLNNALVPESHDYFRELNSWLSIEDFDGRPKWARSVHRWMMEKEVDMELLLAPPEMTAAKAEMREEVNSGIDVLVDAIEHVVGSEGVIRIGDWEPVVRGFVYRVTPMDTEDALQVFKRVMQTRSIPFRDNRVITPSIDGMKYPRRPRIFKNCINKQGEWTPFVRVDKLPESERVRLRDKFTELLREPEKMKEAIDSFLTAKDL